jgi:hypothetical protein
MRTFKEAAVSWAREIDDWYGLRPSVEEAMAAWRKAFSERKFEEEDGTLVPYEDVFFKDVSGHWFSGLDTADREALADAVQHVRGKEALPSYADLGGTLLNKIPVWAQPHRKCGHSACGQNHIDTGDIACIAGREARDA